MPESDQQIFALVFGTFGATFTGASMEVEHTGMDIEEIIRS